MPLWPCSSSPRDGEASTFPRTSFASPRLVTQQGECPIEDLCQLSVRNLMSKQRLNLSELLAEGLAGRKLDLEAFFPQRFRRRAPGARCRSRRRRRGSRRGRCYPRLLGLRELPYKRSDCWLRRTVGQQLLDLTLALVPRAIEEFHVILWREMRREQREPRPVNFSPADPFQHERVRATQAGRADPLKGRSFGEVEHLHAVLEHRREALSDVEPTRVDLSKVRQKIGLEVSVSRDSTTLFGV